MTSQSARPSMARGLTDLERRLCERALLRCGVASPQLCRRATVVTRLHPREPRLREVRGPRGLVAYAALATRADGITLGNDVYIRAPLFGPHGQLPIDLVGHEVAHVAQMLRDGLAPFFGRYVGAYLRGRARGLDDRRAYLAIPFEVEARHVGQTLRNP